MNAPGHGFLKRPGLPGMFGALMDECARAAEHFCRAVEATPPQVFVAKRESDDPDTVSIQSMCAHAVGAAHRYSDYIRQARGLPFDDRYLADPASLPSPASVRPALAASLQYTEESLEGWYENPAAADGLTFQVRWGPTYDSEMILEHAIVHLLRHRRQIERWPA
jgi:uncharacterized damage-inducible protein DinB